MTAFDIENMTQVLCSLAGQEYSPDMEQLLYHIAAVAENEYNADYWRQGLDIINKACANAPEV